MRVEGHVAMVTGGGSGIGRASALAMAGQGADIVIADINAEVAGKVATEVEGMGGAALAMETDTSSKAAVDRIVKAGLERFGKIDILVNAAGIGAMVPVREMSEELFDRVLAVHAKSTFLCSQAVLDSMIQQGWGRIVNITSRASVKPRAGTSAYAAAKAAMLGFSRALAAEVGEQGITVNNVAPGVTLTNMTSPPERTATAEHQVEEQRMLGVLTHPLRYAHPEEIAEAVLYFCGPNSDHTTGMTLHVNGGSFMP